MSDEVYESYIRTKYGETKFLPFREALNQFLSDDGYRITINIEGVELVLRKDNVVDDDVRSLDAHLGQDSVNAMVTIKGHQAFQTKIADPSNVVMTGWDNE